MTDGAGSPADVAIQSLLRLPETTTHYAQFGGGRDVVWIAGGGMLGSDWHAYQVPALPGYRSTTFDNRGIGGTTCDAPLPWTMADFARDTAALIEAVCEPPVAIVGLSMGSFIVLQLALDRPDLVECAVAMGTAANGGEGWLGDYMRAEVDLRRRGGRLEGLFATTHYAAELYPAQALGDPDTWARIKEFLGADSFLEENERSLIGQWDACVRHDVTDRLPGCAVPLHVFAFSEDVQVPPQYGRRVADLAPNAEYHLFEGLGHASLMGHRHDDVNARLREVLARHLG